MFRVSWTPRSLVWVAGSVSNYLPGRHPYFIYLNMYNSSAIRTILVLTVLLATHPWLFLSIQSIIYAVRC